MPLTENERDVLCVETGDPFAAILSRISTEVRRKYGNGVWKGITGPEDGYTSYWIWVQGIHDAVSHDHGLEEDSMYQFKVIKTGVFEANLNGYHHGVNITVAVVKE